MNEIPSSIIIGNIGATSFGKLVAVFWIKITHYTVQSVTKLFEYNECRNPIYISSRLLLSTVDDKVSKRRHFKEKKNIIYNFKNFIR